MITYSHSRINTFEQCKYKYKLQYIDRIKVEVPTTVEAFMGNLVHQALEKLYHDVRYQKIDTKKELISFYHSLWLRKWSDDILIVKEDMAQDNYLKMGEKYLSMYYDHYKPFNQMTILGLETKDRIMLPDGNFYHVRIDKLTCVGSTYYVCDYKTNFRMKSQNEADSDKQLAMYSIWVKDKFKDAKKVVLLWHMLAFDKEVISERNDEQLQELQKEIVSKIKEIESCKEFPTNVTPLCDYCVYKSICPSFKHAVELEQKTLEDFKNDDGVKLVDEYAKLDLNERKIKIRKGELKEKLIAFVKQKEINVVYGSNKKASLRLYPKVIYPNDKVSFKNLLKNKGIYDNVSMISYPKLNSLILKRKVDKDIIDKVKIENNYKISLSKNE